MSAGLPFRSPSVTGRLLYNPAIADADRTDADITKDEGES
jgi:hypothetical protein